MPDQFEVSLEEMTIILGGVSLDLWGVYFAVIDAGGDGRIIEIKWPGGKLHEAHNAGSIKAQMFEAMKREFVLRCASEIAEGIAEGPERRREAYHEHQAEMAMGK